MPADSMPMVQRTSLRSHVDVTPMHDRHKHGIEIEATGCQAVLIAGWALLVSDLLQYSRIHKLPQPCCEQGSRNPKPLLKIFESTDAQEAFPKYQQSPAVADHGHRTCHRAFLIA